MGIFLWALLGLAAAVGSESAPGGVLGQDDTCTSEDADCGLALAQLRSSRKLSKDRKNLPTEEDGAKWDNWKVNYSSCAEEVPVSNFNYENPELWRNAYPTCGLGGRQSPIDIKADIVEEADAELRADYTVAKNLTRMNDGHALLIQPAHPTDLGVLHVRWGGRAVLSNFTALQFHFHTPSEHTFNGEHFCGEMHIVHMQAEHKVGADPAAFEITPDDVLAVVAIIFTLDPGDKDNPCLQSLLGDAVREGCAEHMDSYDLGCFKQQTSGPFFSYPGSLTVPGCRQGVTFHVMQTPALISKRQLNVLNAMFPPPGNSRPVQPRDNRAVFHHANYDSRKLAKP